MMRNNLQRALVAAALSTLLASPALALGFSDLIVFGDSIVDTGNTQDKVVTETGGAVDPAPAADGYFEGRFTNGVNPADVVNQAIEGTNLTGSRLGGDNYSYGGARARVRSDGAIEIPDLALQVDEYLGAVASAPDPNALYLINVGGNDIRDILLDSLDPVTVINEAVTSIVTQVGLLQGLGADHFLFVGVGDVGAIPEIQPFGQAAIDAGRALSEQMNAAIAANVAPLGVDFYDTIGFFDSLLPILQGAGINVTEACLDSPDADPIGAPTCNGYAFFDTVHPSTQPLQLLGDDIVAFVPEPSTGLLVGLGLLVMAGRRRQAA